MSRARVTRIAVAVLVVVLAEVAARIVMGGTTPAVRWYDETAALKVEQMGSRAQVNTVFAGTSSAAQAFVPSHYPRPSYNAGLAGGTPGVMSPWLLDEVLPRLEPRTVVWGLTSLDLAPAYGDRQAAAYADAPATSDGALATIDRWVSERSTLVRERSILRSPSALVGDQDDDRAARARAARRALGEDGERIDFSENTDSTARAINAARLQGFVPAEDDLNTIASTVDALTDAGVTVILVELPVPRRFIDLHPDGDAGHAQVGVALSQLAADRDVRFLDLSGGFADGDFVDFTHLDAEPARRFTDLAAAAVDSGRTDVVADTADRPAEPTLAPVDCELRTVVDEYGDLIEICVDPGDVNALPAADVGVADDLAALHRLLFSRLALDECGAAAIDVQTIGSIAPAADRDATETLVRAINRAHASCASFDEGWGDAVAAAAALAEVAPASTGQPASVLVAVALDSLAVRWELAGPSSGSGFWTHPNEILLTSGLRARTEAGEPATAAAFGSSMGMRAIDQPLMRAEWEADFINASLASTDEEEWQLLLPRVTADMKLETVLWTTSTHRMINDRGRSPCGTVPTNVTQSVQNRTNMFRHEPGDDVDRLLGPDGHVAYAGTPFANPWVVFTEPGDRRVAEGTTFEGVLDAERDGRYVDAQLCGRRIDALRDILEEFRSGDLNVVLVVLPIHPAYVSLAPTAHAEAADALRTLSADLDITLVEFEPLTDGETSDGLHVNAAGRQRITAHILEALGAR